MFVDIIAATASILTQYNNIRTNTHPGEDQTMIILEPFGTEVVDPPADKKVICLQTFIGLHLLSGVVRCLKDQIVGDVNGLDCRKIFNFYRKLTHLHEVRSTYLLINCLYLCLETGFKSVQYGLFAMVSSIVGGRLLVPDGLV